MAKPSRSPAPDDRTDELERQVERDALFTNGEVARAFAQTEEISAFLYGMADLLIEAGVFDADALTGAALRVQVERAEKGERVLPAAVLRSDDPEAEASEPVDCAARMHVCHAVCCTFDFALTAEEVEAGHAKFDLGRPYFIRHDASGYCTHNDSDSHGCTIYDDRPGLCHAYTCANDTRIWSDFDNMVLNDAFLSQPRESERPVLLRTTRLAKK
jgi:hypothetical protein